MTIETLNAAAQAANLLADEAGYDRREAHQRDPFDLRDEFEGYQEGYQS